MAKQKWVLLGDDAKRNLAKGQVFVNAIDTNAGSSAGVALPKHDGAKQNWLIGNAGIGTKLFFFVNLCLSHCLSFFLNLSLLILHYLKSSRLVHREIGSKVKIQTSGVDNQK